nr:hypothetical protein [Paenibacillus sp. Soil766]
MNWNEIFSLEKVNVWEAPVRRKDRISPDGSANSGIR